MENPVHSLIVWTPQLQMRVVDGIVNLVAAILILVIGWTIAALINKWLGRVLERMPRFDPTLRPPLLAVIRYGIVAVTVIAVLQRFGVETTSLIAILGAIGLAIGLALQGTLSNVASGVMLLLLRPFHAGDYITYGAGGTMGGTVREVGLFRTILITADLVFVSVPNSEIFSTSITNYSREPVRRINFILRIPYSDNVEKAQALIMEEVKKDTRIMSSPAPVVPIGELGPSSVDLIVRCWARNAQYWDVLFDLQKAIKLRFDSENITISAPQQLVVMRDSAAKAQ